MIGLGMLRSKYDILVLDTAAFIARLQLAIYGVEMVTTPSVVEEVKDLESRSGLEYSLDLHRVKIENPSDEFVRTAKEIAERLGVSHRLSKTDFEVVALALEKASKGLKVAVVTDDYCVQNVVAYSGIEFIPVKTMGIKGVKTFKRKSSLASL